MKNIAFIGTEYQQNILFSICLQNNIKIDTLFLREGISLQKNANSYVCKVVYFENISFSWRSIKKYYQVYQKSIAPNLNAEEEYRVFVWSLVNPLSRYAINMPQYKNIDLIEDGSGSYAKWGFNNFHLGIKAFVSSTVIFSLTNIISMSLLPLNRRNIQGWSLFDNCYPELKIKKSIIDHQYFQKIINDGLNDKSEKLELRPHSIIFIISAYVEYGILTEDEFFQIMIETLEKMKKQIGVSLNTIYWKPHPRANIEAEKVRLHKIQIATNIHFDILSTDINMESIALVNQNKNLQYYSLGSSSLYVIKALVPDETTVCLVENEVLKNKAMNQSQLVELYRSIGIEIL